MERPLLTLIFVVLEIMVNRSPPIVESFSQNEFNLIASPSIVPQFPPPHLSPGRLPPPPPPPLPSSPPPLPLRPTPPPPPPSTPKPAFPYKTRNLTTESPDSMPPPRHHGNMWHPDVRSNRNRQIKKKPDSKFNPGKKFGIVFAGIAGILQIAVLGFLLLKRRQISMIKDRHGNCSS